MKLELINNDNLSEKLSEVSSEKEYENGKLSKKGIFSRQIFGPTRSYFCECNKGKYRGKNYEYSKCRECGVDITTEKVRRERFAKIKLPFPILNPIIYYILIYYKPGNKIVIENMLYYRRKYIMDNSKLVPINEDDDYNENDLYIGLGGVLKYIDYLIENEDNDKIEFIKENKDKIVISNVLVLPPTFRPMSKSSNGRIILDEINLIYNRLIGSVKRSNDYVLDSEFMYISSSVFESNFRNIQSLVINLYEFIINKLSKKSGLIRQNILGKRVDFSARCVIAPDPKLSLDECSIPYVVLLELIKPQFSCFLVDKRKYNHYSQALTEIDRCLLEEDYMLYDLLCEFTENKTIVLNRQPTLHRLGVLGFKIKVNKELTLKIHPMTCHGFNADFDGDAMALYLPISEEAENDVKDKIGIWNNLLSPTDMTSVPQPNQDIILGIYNMTKEQDPRVKEIKGTKLSTGRYLFNMCLPSNYPVIDKVINKDKLKFIINDIVMKYNSDIAIKTLDKIKILGFEASSRMNYTLALNDIYNPKLTEIASTLSDDDFKKNIEIINSEETKKELKNMPFADYIKSGSRGSWDQAKQLCFCRGYVADSDNNILKNPIKSNFAYGLSKKEFFNSCYGARKGLLDTAIITGDSGYITRQLIYSSCSIEMGNHEDCGTDEYLELDLSFTDDVSKAKAEKLVKSVLWRNCLNEETGELFNITTNNCKELLGKKIKIRSPFYCKDKKICKACYGSLHKILHSDQIGTVATQAIGERTTQLVLRTFHISGVANIKAGSDKNEDIVSGMELVNKIFHSPVDLINLGDINIENNKQCFQYLLNYLYNIFSEYGNILMVHYEVILSGMAWTEDDTIWRVCSNRDNIPINWNSILKVPGMRSWLLGIAFSNIKNKLLSGLIESKDDSDNFISSLFKF